MNEAVRKTWRALIVAAPLCCGCGAPDTAPGAQVVLSMKQGGAWQEQKYVGGEWGDVTEIVAPPQATDHSEYIRFEGPGIESDLVGYRFYLDWRNGFDIFGKKTRELVLQDVGLDGYEAYHEPADWGMDILTVGESLGIGGFGYWDGNAVQRVSDVAQRSARVLENGPGRAMLELRYDGWQAGGKATDLVATLAMTPGSRIVDVELAASPPPDNLAIGIVKHPDGELTTGVTENGHGYLATWGPQSIIGDGLGMALVYRQADLIEVTGDAHSHVVVLRPGDGELAYAFMAAWVQEPDAIATEAAFLEAVERAAAARAEGPR